MLDNSQEIVRCVRHKYVTAERSVACQPSARYISSQAQIGCPFGITSLLLPWALFVIHTVPGLAFSSLYRMLEPHRLPAAALTRLLLFACTPPTALVAPAGGMKTLLLALAGM